MPVKKPRYQGDVDKLREKVSNHRRNNEKNNQNLCKAQLHEPETSGVNQKYKRIGGLQFVNIGVNPTLESIQKACHKAFGDIAGKACYYLTGDLQLKALIN